MNLRTFSPAAVLPLTLALWVLVLACALYHSLVQHLPLLEALPLGLLQGLICTALLWFGLRTDLVRASLLWLALPYLFFIPGWLNTPTALGLGLLCSYSLWRVLATTRPVRAEPLGWRGLAAFLLILAWVNLSGAGGYGYQSSDWSMHNARLHDLIQRPWPIRYADNQNLVYYLGYFLPSAAVGKLVSVDAGLKSLFPWTVLGVVLAIRWLAHLSQWPLGTALVLVFAFFGPLDLLNVLFMNVFSPATTLLEDFSTALRNTDHLDFRLWRPIGFFIGNYLSNTFQLYWSPQQVISGWLAMGLISHLYLTRQLCGLVFTYALLCLWAPFAMIALSPFVALAVLREWPGGWRHTVTLENTVGAGALALVFVVFYLSGSTTQNLSFWMHTQLPRFGHYVLLLAFYLFAWGLYALACRIAVRDESREWRMWFLCLLISLLCLPLYVFGDYADLLCRGSAPLMFLLLVFLLRAFRYYHEQRRHDRAAWLLLMLCIGSASALLQNRQAILHYGHTQPVRSVIDYHNAFPNLGPDGTAFERWFRKKLP